jgi:hypothetical protein
VRFVNANFEPRRRPLYLRRTRRQGNGAPAPEWHLSAPQDDSDESSLVHGKPPQKFVIGNGCHHVGAKNEPMPRNKNVLGRSLAPWTPRLYRRTTGPAGGRGRLRGIPSTGVNGPVSVTSHFNAAVPRFPAEPCAADDSGRTVPRRSLPSATTDLRTHSPSVESQTFGRRRGCKRHCADPRLP